MRAILSLVRWFCRQISLDELNIALSLFLEVINGDRPDIRCKDNFRPEHPNYRKYTVDAEPPLTEYPKPQIPKPAADYKALLKTYQRTHGKAFAPVRRRKGATSVPSPMRCEHCNAPSKYLYYNDGNKRSQLRCKLCGHLFALRRHRRPSKIAYWCPLCGATLYRWKTSADVTIYKCPNDHCPRYLANKRQLNSKERKLQKTHSSQFKLRYQHRVYHFDPGSLAPAAPDPGGLGPIDHIYKSLDEFGLALAFSVSCGLSARQTAYILKNVFNVSISHQTVLNYQRKAAVLCHAFNLEHKATPDPVIAGDETYVRVADAWNYAFFTIGANSRAIHAYHLADSRGALPATIALKETLRARPEHLTVSFVADGNPSYDSAVHYLNKLARDAGKPEPLKRRSVIGLTNDDPESAQYRPFKQIVERLNRTYKFHTRSRSGFKDFNGALALTVLFVTHYNYLRPHFALRHRAPIDIPQLEDIQTLQGRWIRILNLAADLHPAEQAA